MVVMVTRGRGSTWLVVGRLEVDYGRKKIKIGLGWNKDRIFRGSALMLNRS